MPDKFGNALIDAWLATQFRRLVFNIVARNQDDHVKNIAFLMNQQGEWPLAPAFDVTYSDNPSGAWTARHQMTLNGKRTGSRGRISRRARKRRC